MTQDFPSRWPVRCPRCARRIMVELEYGTEPGRMGIVECPEGHAFLFRYDGVTVGVLTRQPEARRRSL
jgi:hypothetical protein